MYFNLNGELYGLIGPKFRGTGARECTVSVQTGTGPRTVVTELVGKADETFAQHIRVMADQNGDGVRDFAVGARFLDRQHNIRLYEYVYSGKDFALLREGKREEAMVLAPAGDINYDGVVDEKDLRRWKDTFESGLRPEKVSNPRDPQSQRESKARARRRVLLESEAGARATGKPGTPFGPLGPDEKEPTLNPQRLDINADGTIDTTDLDLLMANLGAARDPGGPLASLKVLDPELEMMLVLSDGIKESDVRRRPDKATETSPGTGKP
ncbi:MAG: hypothetical protein SFY95_03975 [Planctomycetota bacterium]|nr:hypothetical protein [Planctomycetota bacterium]